MDINISFCNCENEIDRITSKFFIPVLARFVVLYERIVRGIHNYMPMCVCIGDSIS